MYYVPTWVVPVLCPIEDAIGLQFMFQDDLTSRKCRVKAEKADFIKHLGTYQNHNDPYKP
jgi:hypothetical protein